MGSNKSSPDHRLSLNLATAPDSGFSSLPPSTVSIGHVTIILASDWLMATILTSDWSGGHLRVLGLVARQLLHDLAARILLQP